MHASGLRRVTPGPPLVVPRAGDGRQRQVHRRQVDRAAGAPVAQGARWHSRYRERLLVLRQSASTKSRAANGRRSSATPSPMTDEAQRTRFGDGGHHAAPSLLPSELGATGRSAPTAASGRPSPAPAFWPVGVQHQQHLVRRPPSLFVQDAHPQLVHQVTLGRQPPGGIGQHHVDVSFLGRVDRASSMTRRRRRPPARSRRRCCARPDGELLARPAARNMSPTASESCFAATASLPMVDVVLPAPLTRRA